MLNNNKIATYVELISVMLKTDSLTPNQLKIIQNKGTDYPFTGEYDELEQPGSYLCRQCGLALFRSQTKFHSGCGWPSFDQTILDMVLQQADLDGLRTEIVCQRCKAHLGHVFKGEGFTINDLRYCVNSTSLDFVADSQIQDTEEAIVAAGCFWGVEYYFKRLVGVVKTEVGYTGGHTINPSYHDVCNINTGHFEAVRILYNPSQLNYSDIIRYFFEIHDPIQINGQGPDIGEQYLSRIFYYDSAQKEKAGQLLQQLMQQGYLVSTQILPVSIFWRAEDYHQDYYQKTNKEPYCHYYTKRF